MTLIPEKLKSTHALLRFLFWLPVAVGLSFVIMVLWVAFPFLKDELARLLLAR